MYDDVFFPFANPFLVPTHAIDIKDGSMEGLGRRDGADTARRRALSLGK